MKIFGAVIFICAALLGTKPAQFDFKSKIGVVDSSEEGKLCLIIANPNLAVADSINLVVLSKPQRVLKTRVTEKLDRSCSKTLTENESFYSLRLERDGGSELKNFDVPLIAVAVVSKQPLKVSRGQARKDLDNDGRPEFFRSCASNEGLHFTVWTGQPLSGKRRWHFYYYLGYDVVLSCKRKDYS